MKNKKYYKEDIVDAIVDKFGSVDDLAKHLGTSRQNIYGKIDRQSRAFIKELITAGVNLNEGIQIGESNIKNNRGDIKIGSSNSLLVTEIENLKNEIAMLREIINGKDEIIALLKSKN
ncbi:MAG: hypothetical protein KKF62_14120 [Bacteroidetes bacterium]|nr:hypothetical protein [Bacteroidota bacterium]MBU1114196.1 hypothetical protein [Bacteroidota bacterium]MBU1797006.1 hypothetical protein [Bacteroidota bacterium]